MPIYEFLAKYEGWIADSNGDYCDLALGNPQTMPLDEFVAALREATTPRDKSWYAYKMNEASSREIVCASLKTLTGFEYPQENIFMTNGATGALLAGPDAEKRRQPLTGRYTLQNRDLSCRKKTPCQVFGLEIIANLFYIDSYRSPFCDRDHCQLV